MPPGDKLEFSTCCREASVTKSPAELVSRTPPLRGVPAVSPGVGPGLAGGITGPDSMEPEEGGLERPARPSATTRGAVWLEAQSETLR